MLSEFTTTNLPFSFSLSSAIVASWLALVLVLAEWTARSERWGKELSRKVVHIGVGNVLLLAWWLQIPAWLGVAAAIAASGATLLSYRYPLLSSISSVGRKSWGTFFYAVSIGVLIAWFWPLGHPAFAVLGVLVMTWGDGLAALVGQRYGRHPYQVWGMTKSWEGSLTMAIATALVSGTVLSLAYGLDGRVWLCALAIALVATTLEAFSKFGVDNLTVPLGSAAVSYWLMQGGLG